MRYFYISFAHELAFGWLTLQLEEYPSLEGIIKSVQEKDPNMENITVISITELNKVDFDSFIS